MQGRLRRKRPGAAEPDQDDHEREAGSDAEVQPQGGSSAIMGARCRKQNAVGPGSIDDATTKARNATLPDCTVGRRPDQPPDRSD
jgi:hypothetical protein